MRDKICRSFIESSLLQLPFPFFFFFLSLSHCLSFYLHSLTLWIFCYLLRLFISCVWSINSCRFQINAYTQFGMWIHVKSTNGFIYFRFYDHAIRSRLTFHPLYLSFAIVNSLKSNPILCISVYSIYMYIRPCVFHSQQISCGQCLLSV